MKFCYVLLSSYYGANRCYSGFISKWIQCIIHISVYIITFIIFLWERVQCFYMHNAQKYIDLRQRHTLQLIRMKWILPDKFDMMMILILYTFFRDYFESRKASMIIYFIRHQWIFVKWTQFFIIIIMKTKLIWIKYEFTLCAFFTKNSTHAVSSVMYVRSEYFRTILMGECVMYPSR